MKEKLNEMCNHLMELPAKISDLQYQILDKTEIVNSTQSKIQVIESKIKTDISNAVDANGKKVYSNEDARKAAFIEEVADNSELTELNLTITELQNSIQKMRINVEALNSDQRNIRTLLNFFTNNAENSDQN